LLNDLETHNLVEIHSQSEPTKQPALVASDRS
jgi:hypothetical protein